MAYIEVNLSSDIVYVAGTINGVETVFSNQNGKWIGHADTSPDNLYQLWIEVYDAAGNRTEYEETLYYEPITFVTDRTLQDVEGKTPKGVLNAVDVNRIERNIKTIGKMAAIPAGTNADWQIGGLPRASDWQIIREYVQIIRDYAHRSTTPQVPARPLNHFQKINDVEQILKDAYYMITSNSENINYAGEFYAGEGGFL